MIHLMFANMLHGLGFRAVACKAPIFWDLGSCKILASVVKSPLLTLPTPKPAQSYGNRQDHLPLVERPRSIILSASAWDCLGVGSLGLTQTPANKPVPLYYDYY